MPGGVSPAAEAISASEDAVMLDSEAAAIPELAQQRWRQHSGRTEGKGGGEMSAPR